MDVWELLSENTHMDGVLSAKLSSYSLPYLKHPRQESEGGINKGMNPTLGHFGNSTLRGRLQATHLLLISQATLTSCCQPACEGTSTAASKGQVMKGDHLAQAGVRAPSG